MSAIAPVHPPVAPSARVLYCIHLGSCVLVVASVALAIGSGERHLLVQAALAAAVALLSRQHLAERGWLEACAAEDDTPVASWPAAPNAETDEFRAMAARCAELEALRGTPRFDPWELAKLRRALASRNSSR